MKIFYTDSLKTRRKTNLKSVGRVEGHSCVILIVLIINVL